MTPLYMPGWNLSISESDFDKIYGEKLDKNIFKHLPDNDKEFIDEFLPSKLWRMNQLYTIVDKKGRKTIFRMNWAQHMIHNYGLMHPRLIILKSRQQGISTYYLVKFFDDAITVEDLNIGLMSQGKRESSILLTRTKLMIDEIDDGIRQFLQVSTSKDNTEAVEFNNNSKILIGVSFRSQTLQRLHISEYGKISNENPKRAEETKTGTLQAIAPGNEVAIESTAEGDNEFKYMWDAATEVSDEERAPKDFLPVFLSWADDADCQLDIHQSDTRESLEYFSRHEANGWEFTRQQKNWWISQFRELKTRIKQEYPLHPEEAFEASRQGAYWHRSWEDFGVEKENLYDPKLEVFGVMDLSVNDTNSVYYFQYYNKQKRIIWEYGNNNQGVRHYVEVLARKSQQLGIGKVTLFLPHDGTKRAQTDLKTAADLYRDYGHKVIVLERPKNKLEAIEHTRDVIDRGHLAIDSSCRYALKTMANYSRQWDSKLEEWKKDPLHNIWSHYADAIIYTDIASVPDLYVKRFERKFYGRKTSGFSV